jgi:hypothetical protein
VASFAYGSLNISLAKQLQAHTEEMLAEAGFDTPLSKQQLQEITADAATAVFQLPQSVPNTSSAGAEAASTANLHSSFLFRHAVLNPVEQNSALVFNLQLGPIGGDASYTAVDGSASAAREVEMAQIRTSVLLQLLAQLLGEAGFNVLRTRWSLGYMVWSIPRVSLGSGGNGRFAVSNFDFIVQNAYDSPRALEARVEEFLELFREETLEPLSDADFEQQRSTLATALTQARDARLSMTTHFLHAWTAVWRDADRPAFARETVQLRILEKITHADLLAFFDDYFRADGARRRKSVMLLYGAGQVAEAEADTALIAQRTEQAQEALARDVELGPIEQRQQQRRELQWTTWTT